MEGALRFSAPRARRSTACTARRRQRSPRCSAMAHTAPDEALQRLAAPVHVQAPAIMALLETRQSGRLEAIKALATRDNERDNSVLTILNTTKVTERAEAAVRARHFPPQPDNAARAMRSLRSQGSSESRGRCQNSRPSRPQAPSASAWRVPQCDTQPRSARSPTGDAGPCPTATCERAQTTASRARGEAIVHALPATVGTETLGLSPRGAPRQDADD